MAIFEKKIIVQKDDIDINGHVSNVRYLEWFINSAVEHSDFLGVGVKVLQKNNRTWVAKEHYISYKQSAFEGDELVMKTWVDSVKIAQSIRKYELYNLKTDKIVCEGWTNWVFVEMQTYRPCKITNELIGKYLEIKDNL